MSANASQTSSMPCSSVIMKRVICSLVIGSTPDGQGYWMAASDGGIFSFGDAGFYGSTGSIQLNAPITGVQSSPSGRGYWLVASDGGIFPFGDAKYHSYGSTGNIRLNQPIVGMAATMPSSLPRL